MNYQLLVNDEWITLVNRAVKKYLETWPGGDPDEQVAYALLSKQLDKLSLEVLFDTL